MLGLALIPALALGSWLPAQTAELKHFAPPAPAPGRAWQPAWNLLVAEALEDHAPELLDGDVLPRAEVERFCPGFFSAPREDRRAFWTLFIAAITRFESGFDASARMKEAWRDPETLKPQWSEGLLQLSYSDVRGHPECALDRRARNISRPEVNLACGVAILRRQIAHRGALFPPKRPCYWAVLTSKKLRPKVEKYFAAQTAAITACRR